MKNNKKTARALDMLAMLIAERTAFDKAVIEALFTIAVTPAEKKSK